MVPPVETSRRKFHGREATPWESSRRRDNPFERATIGIIHESRWSRNLKEMHPDKGASSGSLGVSEAPSVAMDNRKSSE